VPDKVEFPASLAERISRNVFLCFGAVGVFCLLGWAILGEENRRVMASLDWSNPEFVLYVTWGVGGALFLAAAYGFYARKRWAAPLGVVVSASALAFMVVAWLSETTDRRGFAVVLSVPATPIFFSFIWTVAETARRVKNHKANSTNRERPQIA
jgi:hypothetical protein